MEQNPLEANIPSSNKEICHILWYVNILYLVQEPSFVLSPEPDDFSHIPNSPL